MEQVHQGNTKKIGETRQLTVAGLLQLDPWLEPFTGALKSRYSHAQNWLKTINETEGGLEKFSRGYEKFGFTVNDNGDVTYREWAPSALRAYLIGDFSTDNLEDVDFPQYA